MNEQTIAKERISEDPDNYRSIFERTIGDHNDLRSGAIEPTEASARARTLGVGQRVLDGDLKARLVDHRLKAKLVGSNSSRIEPPKPAA